MSLLQKLRFLVDKNSFTPTPILLRGLCSPGFDKADTLRLLNEQGVITLPSQMLNDEAWEKLTALSYAIGYNSLGTVHHNTFYVNCPHSDSIFIGEPKQQCEEASRLLQPIESFVRSIVNYEIYLRSISAFRIESDEYASPHPHNEIAAVVYLDIKGDGGGLAFQDPVTKNDSIWTPQPHSIVLIKKNMWHEILPVKKGGMRRSLTMLFDR